MTGEKMRVVLRPHQQKAVSAAVSALVGGGRATVVAACGTGKTVIGAAAAARLAPTGRVLVLVPTLELLAQAAAEWMRAGRGGLVLAVCGYAEALQHHHTPIGDATTDPAAVAALGRSDTAAATWFATYASLPQLSAAQHTHGLAAFDLVVADEAHRTTGRLGRRWVGVHDDTVLRARRRLYLTATPRVFDTEDTAVASMHDETVFGPIVYRLGFGEAIAARLLADYRVLVPVVTDTEMAQLAAGARPAAELAAQVAVLRAAKQYGLRRVISYHSRVAAARRFATGLTAAAALLDPCDRPAGVWAGWISGGRTHAERRAMMDHLRSPAHEFALLANARILGEGVDVPAVDAVVLNDPKRSIIDTVQAVGRALRTGGVRGKIATIIVPAVVSADDDPETILDTTGYDTVWRVLRALRAHDDRLDDHLRALAHTTSADAGTDVRLDWLHIDGIDRAEDLALAISLRLVDAKSAEWRRGYAAARRYHATHGHLDAPQTYRDAQGVALGSWLSWQRWQYSRGQLPRHRAAALEALDIIWEPRKNQWERGLAAARRYHAEHGTLAMAKDVTIDGVRLGAWLNNLRNRVDRLDPQRRAALDAIDPWWNPPWRVSWQRLYSAARDFHAEHGHLDIPRTYTHRDMRLGEWLHAQRRHRDQLDERQRRMLDDLGIDWGVESPFVLAWRRGLSAAITYYETHGHLDVPQKYVAPDGYRLGTWINNLRTRANRPGGLPPGRRAALDALGMRWTPPATGSSETPVAATAPTPHQKKKRATPGSHRRTRGAVVTHAAPEPIPGIPQQQKGKKP